MTPETLKNIRKSWGYTQPLLAALLATPLRTYQDWESGRGRIPGIIAVTLGLLLERDRRITAEIIADLKASIVKELSADVPSVMEVDR